MKKIMFIALLIFMVLATTAASPTPFDNSKKVEGVEIVSLRLSCDYKQVDVQLLVSSSKRNGKVNVFLKDGQEIIDRAFVRVGKGDYNNYNVSLDRKDNYNVKSWEQYTVTVKSSTGDVFKKTINCTPYQEWKPPAWCEKGESCWKWRPYVPNWYDSD